MLDPDEPALPAGSVVRVGGNVADGAATSKVSIWCSGGEETMNGRGEKLGMKADGVRNSEPKTLGTVLSTGNSRAGSGKNENGQGEKGRKRREAPGVVLLYIFDPCDGEGRVGLERAVWLQLDNFIIAQVRRCRRNPDPEDN